MVKNDYHLNNDWMKELNDDKHDDDDDEDEFECYFSMKNRVILF
jgi:hypothetical protein